jgi:hypothetical protein
MKRLSLVVASVMVALILAIVWLAGKPAQAQGPIPRFSGPPFGSTIQTVPNSSTAVTANTLQITDFFCTNTTATAATITLTDTAGNVIVSAKSIAAHDFVALIQASTGGGGIVAVGVKWQAGTASALNCYLGGAQALP